MTSISVLQSFLLYLYHLYQIWPLEKETGHCERKNISNLVKLAVMTDFLALGFESFLRRFRCSMYSWLFFTFLDERFGSLSWRFESLSFLNSLNLDSNPFVEDSDPLVFFFQNLHFFTNKFESMS